MTKVEVDKHLPLILEYLLDSGQTNKSVAEDVGCTAMQIKRALYVWRRSEDQEVVTKWDKKRKKVITQTRRGGMAKAHTAMRKKWAEASGTTHKTPLQLIEGAPITPEEVERLTVYWRPTGTAANYNLSGARTMLRENSKLTICGVARVMEYDPKALENALNRSNQKREEAGLSEEEWHELEVLWWDKMTWLKERNMANDQVQVKIQAPATTPEPVSTSNQQVLNALLGLEVTPETLALLQKRVKAMEAEVENRSKIEAEIQAEKRRKELLRWDCTEAVQAYMSAAPDDYPSVNVPGFAVDAVKSADEDYKARTSVSPAISLEPLTDQYHGGYLAGLRIGLSQAGTLVKSYRESLHPYVFAIWHSRISALQKKEAHLTKGLRANLIRFIYMAMLEDKTCNGLTLAEAFAARNNPWLLDRDKVVKAVRELHGSLIHGSTRSKAVVEYRDAHATEIKTDMALWLKTEQDLVFDIKLTMEGLKQAERLLNDPALTCASKTENSKNEKEEEFNG